MAHEHDSADHPVRIQALHGHDGPKCPPHTHCPSDPFDYCTIHMGGYLCSHYSRGTTAAKLRADINGLLNKLHPEKAHPLVLLTHFHHGVDCDKNPGGLPCDGESRIACHASPTAGVFACVHRVSVPPTGRDRETVEGIIRVVMAEIEQEEAAR